MTKKMLLRSYALPLRTEEPIPPLPTTWTEVKTFTSRSLSTNYAVPQSAWYRLHLIGVGGTGGGGGAANAGRNQGGSNYSGGGGGGYCRHTAYLKKGQSLNISIKTGGTSVNLWMVESADSRSWAERIYRRIGNVKQYGKRWNEGQSRNINQWERFKLWRVRWESR